jgi:predicted MFS family arabinose efflux permease
VLGLVAAWIYSTLPKEASPGVHVQTSSLHKSRKIVHTLAALFSLDSFGGGFVVQSMVALWLFQKFQLSTMIAGTIFFWTGILSAFSYLLAVRLANRWGLVNTMTAVPRSLASAASPAVAGYLLSVSSFGWPLLIAGALKVAYDLLLLAMCRKVQPPEESARLGTRG